MASTCDQARGRRGPDALPLHTPHHSAEKAQQTVPPPCIPLSLSATDAPSSCRGHPAAYLPWPACSCRAGPGLWDAPVLVGTDSLRLRVTKVLWQPAGSPAAATALAVTSTAGGQPQSAECRVAAARQHPAPGNRPGEVPLQREAASPRRRATFLLQDHSSQPLRAIFTVP